MLSTSKTTIRSHARELIGFLVLTLLMLAIWVPDQILSNGKMLTANDTLNIGQTIIQLITTAIAGPTVSVSATIWFAVSLCVMTLVNKGKIIISEKWLAVITAQWVISFLMIVLNMLAIFCMIHNGWGFAISMMTLVIVSAMAFGRTLHGETIAWASCVMVISSIVMNLIAESYMTSDFYLIMLKSSAAIAIVWAFIQFVLRTSNSHEIEDMKYDLGYSAGGFGYIVVICSFMAMCICVTHAIINNPFDFKISKEGQQYYVESLQLPTKANIELKTINVSADTVKLNENYFIQERTFAWNNGITTGQDITPLVVIASVVVIFVFIGILAECLSIRRKIYR